MMMATVAIVTRGLSIYDEYSLAIMIRNVHNRSKGEWPKSQKMADDANIVLIAVDDSIYNHEHSMLGKLVIWIRSEILK